MMKSAWSYSTDCASSINICLITPVLSASIWLRIFIASIMHSVSPSLTDWPTSIKGRNPGSRTVECPHHRWFDGMPWRLAGCWVTCNRSGGRCYCYRGGSDRCSRSEFAWIAVNAYRLFAFGNFDFCDVRFFNNFDQFFIFLISTIYFLSSSVWWAACKASSYPVAPNPQITLCNIREIGVFTKRLPRVNIG